MKWLFNRFFTALAGLAPLPKVNYRGTIGSGGLGGVTYIMAAGFANLADKHVPGLSLTVHLSEDRKIFHRPGAWPGCGVKI